MTTTSSLKKARLPINSRAKTSDLPQPDWYPTADSREIKILEALQTYQTLTTNQLSDLFFPPSGLVRGGKTIEQPRDASTATAAARQTLKRLFHYGYVDRVYRIGQPTRYFLDKKGATLLEQITGQPNQFYKKDKVLSDSFIVHLERTNDVWVHILKSVQKNGYSVVEQVSDYTIRKTLTKEDFVETTNGKGKRHKLTSVADGFFRIRVASEQIVIAFIEADLGTEPVESDDFTRRSWQRAISTYLPYLASERYEQRYKTKAGRIFTITAGSKEAPGERRLAHMKELTERLGGKSRFWFTTFDRLQGVDFFTSAVWDIASRQGQHAIVAP